MYLMQSIVTVDKHTWRRSSMLFGDYMKKAYRQRKTPKLSFCASVCASFDGSSRGGGGGRVVCNNLTVFTSHFNKRQSSVFLLSYWCKQSLQQSP